MGNARYRPRGDTAANWTATNPVLAIRELGIETDTRKVKFGDGVTAWNALGFMTAGVAVSGSFTVSGYTMTTGRLLGRTIAGTGAPEELTPAAVKTFLAFTKADVGLGNVDNTADASKDVLSASKLTVARTINGQAFDGSANITISAVDATARAPATRSIGTTAPLAGGGDLTADRVLSITAATGAAAGSMSAADKTKLDAVTGTNTGDQFTAVTASRLLGRGSAGGAGAAQEIILGTNLSISGNTLNAATGSAVLADGTYTDITASGAGSVLTINNGVVSLAKMANVAAGTIFYRKTAGNGAPEVQTLATLKTDLALAKADVGLSSVDNTADAAKNVLSATKLTTARNINGVAFDGTGSITINAVDSTARLPTSAVSAFGLTLIDDADAATARATLGLGSNATDSTARAPATRLISTTAPLNGGGDLSADRTLSISAATSGAAGSMSAADKMKLDAISGTNTGDQFNAVAASKLLGRGDSGSGAAQEITLGTNLSMSGTTLNATGGGGGGSPGGSDRQFQYNNASAFGGAANVLLDASGNLKVAYASASTTPAADSLSLEPQRLLAGGGRVLPRFKDESGVFNTMQPHVGRNSVSWYQGTNGSVAPIMTGLGAAGITALGTITSRVPAGTNRATRTRRTGYVSAATAGQAAGFYASTAVAAGWTLGSGSIAGGGGFFTVIRWVAGDAAAVAGAHMFLGMSSSVAAPGVTTNPSALTNVIGIAQLNGGANLNIVYGGSASQTAIDLGANFPAAGLSTDVYELILYAPPGSNNTVYYRVERINTGDVASGTLTGTAGTALPANTTFLGPRMYRSNNATALAVGLDIASFTIESDF